MRYTGTLHLFIDYELEADNADDAESLMIESYTATEMARPCGVLEARMELDGVEVEECEAEEG